MKSFRSVRWLLLAFMVFAIADQQRVSAQAPGTLRTGTFVWDGARWMPVENPAPPVEEAAPAPDADDEVTADTPPPPLPVYEQPPCPEPNLIWTPGHWRWGLLGYYWVPGAWVPAPYIGALWTPPYWGFVGGHYGFHTGYWGPHIGFYGGVNYGGGYMGIGFAGGTWNGGVFAYNTAVVHVNERVVTNVYINRTIVEQTTIVNTNHVAFSGGPNGVQHQPTPEEQTALHESHTPPTKFQQQHIATAKSDTSNLAKNNGGHPTNLASTKPLAAEQHPAPAGFKPPPPKPPSELAKAQAPPSTIAAVKTASAKTAAVAKVPTPAPKAAPEPAAKGTPAMRAGEPEHAPAASTTTGKPTGTTAPKAGAMDTEVEHKGAPTSAPKTTEKAPEPEHNPAVTPAPKAVVKAPAPKPAVAPAPKMAPKPAPKPATKPAPKPEPKEKEKKP